MLEPMIMPAQCPVESDVVEPLVKSAGRWLCRIQNDTPVADQVEHFIRQRFQLAYGARPTLRIAQLLALVSAEGSLLAAVGVRNAAFEKLFLEDYLDRPVQSLLPDVSSNRGAIAEIAHLAGVEAGVSRYLFASLAVWLEALNYQWVVCTGTDQLRNSFRRMGIDVEVLGVADPARLADGGKGWGRYYQHGPKVLAINVEQGLAALEAAGLLATTCPVAGGFSRWGLGTGGDYVRIA